MGLEHKKNVGTYMGDQETHEKMSAVKPVMPTRSGFKVGDILEGLPDRTNNFPKNGSNLAPSFQNIRTQDPAQGKI